MFGGILEIIVGLIVFYNVRAFEATPGEFAIIMLICVYGVISGAIRVSPYLDEGADWLIATFGFKIRSFLYKKK